MSDEKMSIEYNMLKLMIETTHTELEKRISELEASSASHAESFSDQFTELREMIDRYSKATVKDFDWHKERLNELKEQVEKSLEYPYIHRELHEEVQEKLDVGSARQTEEIKIVDKRDAYWKKIRELEASGGEKE